MQFFEEKQSNNIIQEQYERLNLRTRMKKLIEWNEN